MHLCVLYRTDLAAAWCWGEASHSLNEQLDYELLKDPVLQPKDRESAFQHLALLYIKYIQVFRKLEDSYHQILHPQKRRLLKEVVISVAGRLLEIKHHIVGLECSDFHNFNDILLDLKLTPDHLRLSVPKYIVEERYDEIKSRIQLLDKLGAKPFGFGDIVQNFPEMSTLEAIRTIQKHERGRQGKRRAKFMQDIKLQMKREKETSGTEEEHDSIEAAIKIQKVYRGFKARMKVKKMLKDDLVFLGMVKESHDPVLQLLSKADINSRRRKILQQQYEEDYLQALINTKEKIMKIEGPDMREAIQDDFRQWYMEYKRANGKFPEFPTSEVWQNPEFKFTLQNTVGENRASSADKSKEKDKSTTAASGKSAKNKSSETKSTKKVDKKDSKKKEKDKTEEGSSELQFKYDQSEYLTLIGNGQTEFISKWKPKDEMENFAQKHDPEIIKAEKRCEIEEEIKKDMFDILQDELKNLKLAVEQEKLSKKDKGKGKGGKKGGGKKGKKGKKEKGKKGKKGKKEKDMTANRTMESLVEELVQTGIMQKHTETHLSQFIGDFNLIDTSITKDIAIYPSLADLQRVVMEYCVMPMCITEPKVGYPKITSILLFGQHGTGKSMLVRALATEMGAQILNLTPRNTANQFQGKANVTKMVHMAFKVAKSQSPSIIYIDNIEMVFAKKVPKDDSTDPKRIKKDLIKNLKGLRETPEHVLLIGSSSKPWDADTKAMMPLFDKIMYCPKPDYSSRMLLWEKFITNHCGDRFPKVNLSMLARMTDGLSAGSIKLVCDRVLTERRIKMVHMRNLETAEFIEQILNLPTENQEEDKLYKDFFEKTPLLKKRAGLLVVPEDEEGDSTKKVGKIPALVLVSSDQTAIQEQILTDTTSQIKDSQATTLVYIDGDSASLQKYVTRQLLDTSGFFKDSSFDQSRAHGTRYLMLARMDALWTARKAIQIGILVDTHPFSADHCILCDQQLLSTSIAHLVVECEQVTGHRIQSGLVPAIQKSRLRLLGRSTRSRVWRMYILGSAVES
ncbi:hypothetical protein BASA61_003469 [Batrachochytrium salamandrivorans]|nr:hypothetical protein BASA61_003469 [Batrachochytrium salamandrivorans]